MKQSPEKSKTVIAGLLPSKRVYLLFLGSILILSLGLRLSGISWGLPNETHSLSYHPDERNILYGISNINLGKFDLNPNYFYYPTFHIYLVFVILQIIGGKISTLATLILIGRFTTVFFGVLSVYLMFLIGKEFDGDKLGLITSAFLAITPLHVIHSHFLTTDVPVTFWILITLLFCLKILNSGAKIWYILAGITGGLAISTKYNAGIVVLPILTAHLLNHWKTELKFSNFFKKRILLSLSILIITFLLTSPYTLLAFSEFKRDITLITIYLNTPNPEWFDTGIGWIYHIKNSLYYGMGAPLLLLSFIGLFVSLWKKRDKSLIILAFVVPYFMWVGNWQARFARFILPIVPFLILLAAYGLFHLWWKYRRIGTLIFLVMFLYTITLTFSYNNVMMSNDPRDQGYAWIDDKIPQNSTIGLLSTFQSTFQFFTPQLDRKKYDLVFTQNISELKDKNINNFIISDFDYYPYLKSNKSKNNYPKESQFLEYLFNNGNYKIIKTFHNEQKFLFINLTNEYLPHDMKYANPKIIIFEKTG
jgi:4-amino-4-deoxy-L-arabinose transferase-like glycosyltransferase